MLEKPNRVKVDRQDDTRPTNIEQLIEKYGLEKVNKYIDEIADETIDLSEKINGLDNKVSTKILYIDGIKVLWSE